ncbi:MAG: hypothetical protein RIR48_2080 [Bacteroidota bacterium]|jgi:predicted transcriptional regulator
MASVIDIKTLSKEQQYQLVIDILKHNKELKSNFDRVLANPNDEISMEYIEKLIAQDFERYDEVFRKLA